jgi:hypothetical protein
MGLSVSVHVDARTAVEQSLLSVDGRSLPVLGLSGERGHVSVFADRPELLRLREAISSVLADLDAAEAQEGESAA